MFSLDNSSEAIDLLFGKEFVWEDFRAGDIDREVILGGSWTFLITRRE